MNIKINLINIPITTKTNYTNYMIAQTEKLLKRMRWKLHFQKETHDKGIHIKQTENYGFKTQLTPPEYE